MRWNHPANSTAHGKAPDETGQDGGEYRDRVRKNRCKLLCLQRFGVGGTGLEPVTSTV